MTNRPDGFYWIKLQGDDEPEVVYYRDGLFHRTGIEMEYPETDLMIEHISDVPLTTPLWPAAQVQNKPRDVVDIVHELRAKVMDISSSEPNTSELRKKISDLTNEVMAPLKEERRIHDFNFMCDEQNNDPAVIDSGEFRWMLGVRYTSSRNVTIYRVGYPDHVTGW